MKKKKGSISNLILILMLVIGLSMMLYPTVSNAWNSRYRGRAIETYAEGVSSLDNDRYEEIWENARKYNENLFNRENFYSLTKSQKADYLTQLTVETTNVMGYIEIPKINVSLPVYHTTEEAVLQTAVGHLEWTSLPVGGENTHAAFSGHRGLPSARLFTDLDQMQVGDTFVLWILDERLTYEVDQISIVEPDDVKSLDIQPGKDLCTLITCTPYGVNSHRLLVRGHRVSNAEIQKNVRVVADALRIEPYIVALILAIPIIFVYMALLLLSDKLTKRKH